MSPLTLAILVVLVASLVAAFFFSSALSDHRKNGRKLPPGPSRLPIIGNLHILGNLPHQTLYKLAKSHGPIMFMQLGYVPTIVVSSAKAAKLFMKTHDAVFGSRPKVLASYYMSYGTKGMAFTEYSPYWRSVRKLCTVQLLSGSKIEYFAPIRKEELGSYVDSLKRAAVAGAVVDFSGGVGDLIQKISCRMIFGVANNNGELGLDLMALIGEGLVLAGAFNVGDYIPFLAPFDLQGLTKRMKAFSKAMDEVLGRIIDEHEKEARWEEKQQRDFVDVLLSLLNQPMMTNDDALSTIDKTNVKAILIDMIVASADTSATTIEWTLTELLRHPRSMECLQNELQNVVGMDAFVEEKHLSKLPYLDMVIKESFRLHPVAPLLVPRESVEDVIVDGYFIPKKSRIIVNAWAIGRDPDVWSDVKKFIPERFIDMDIDLRGQNFELIPFGFGRRGCPGMQLELTLVKLIIAQVVHCFDWKLPNGLLPSELDTNEKFGLSLPRANHLLVVPKYRLVK